MHEVEEGTRIQGTVCCEIVRCWERGCGCGEREVTVLLAHLGNIKASSTTSTAIVSYLDHKIAKGWLQNTLTLAHWPRLTPLLIRSLT